MCKEKKYTMSSIWESLKKNSYPLLLCTFQQNKMKNEFRTLEFKMVRS